MILLFGGDGQLGREMARVSAARAMPLVALSRAQGDITDAAAVAEAIKRHDPSIVINAASLHQGRSGRNRSRSGPRGERRRPGHCRCRLRARRRADDSYFDRLRVRWQQARSLCGRGRDRADQQLWAQQGRRRTGGARRDAAARDPPHLMDLRRVRHELPQDDAPARRNARRTARRRRSARLSDLDARSRGRLAGDCAATARRKGHLGHISFRRFRRDDVARICQPHRRRAGAADRTRAAGHADHDRGVSDGRPAALRIRNSIAV